MVYSNLTHSQCLYTSKLDRDELQMIWTPERKIVLIWTKIWSGGHVQGQVWLGSHRRIWDPESHDWIEIFMREGFVGFMMLGDVSELSYHSKPTLAWSLSREHIRLQSYEPGVLHLGPLSYRQRCLLDFFFGSTRIQPALVEGGFPIAGLRRAWPIIFRLLAQQKSRWCPYIDLATVSVKAGTSK